MLIREAGIEVGNDKLTVMAAWGATQHHICVINSSKQGRDCRVQRRVDLAHSAQGNHT